MTRDCQCNCNYKFSLTAATTVATALTQDDAPAEEVGFHQELKKRLLKVALDSWVLYFYVRS